jgi:hypothetical protein
MSPYTTKPKQQFIAYWIIALKRAFSASEMRTRLSKKADADRCCLAGMPKPHLRRPEVRFHTGSE